MRDTDTEFDRLMEESASKAAQEENKGFIDPQRINQAADHREMLRILRSLYSTMRGMAARDSSRAAQAKAERASRRRKAFQRMILAWCAAAGICIGFIIINVQGLVDNTVVWFVNAAVVSVAMFASGWLIGWSRIWEAEK